MGEVYGFLLTSDIPTPTSGFSSLISMSGKPRIFIYYNLSAANDCCSYFTNYLKTGIPNHSLENYSDQNNEHQCLFTCDSLCLGRLTAFTNSHALLT